MSGFISRFNEYLSNSPKLVNKSLNEFYEQLIVDLINEKISEDPNRESFFVMNAWDVIDKHRNWTDRLTRVRPYYSVKANNSVKILDVLAKLGVGFDCVSEEELRQVLSLGADPQKDIIYANPIKPIKHLKFAEKMSVNVMTFDNNEELLKIYEHFPNARLVIRLRVEDKESIQPFDDKYGCVLTDVPYLLSKAYSLGLNVIGVSFHVGCRCSNASAFSKAIAEAKSVFELAKHNFGNEFTLLNIGGGFPGTGWHTGKGEYFSMIAETINKSLEEHFPQHQYPNLSIIAEPGTYYCASAFNLAVKVIGKRTDMIDGTTKHIHYYINDGVFGSLFGPLWGYPCGKKSLPIKPMVDHQELNRREMTKCTIWGHTLASLDVVAKDVKMRELMTNEWIVFTDVGDYSVSLPTRFCGFNPAHVYSVDNLFNPER